MEELNKTEFNTKYTIVEAAEILCMSVYKLKYYITYTNFQVCKDTDGNIEFTDTDIENLKNQIGMGNTYTISQAAKKLDVPVHKIRYFLERTDYEVARDKMGNREFTEVDLINIKKLMQVRKSSISYEAIGNFILKGNPIDPEASAEIDSNVEQKEIEGIEESEEIFFPSLQHPDTIKALVGTMMKFQSTLDHISDKIERIDEVSEKLDQLDNLAAAEDIADLKKEVKSYLDKSQQMIEESNREVEHRVSNMSLELKEAMAKRREEALKEKSKSIFSRIFNSNR